MILGTPGLGIVAYPNEVNHSLSGLGTVQNAGVGLGTPIAHTYGLGTPIAHTYGLGNVPNDIDLARYRDTWYQGVHHGWIRGKDRFYNDGNLGNTAMAVRGAMGQIEDGEAALQEIAKSERLKARMAVISAVAVTSMALLGIFAFVKGR